VGVCECGVCVCVRARVRMKWNLKAIKIHHAFHVDKFISF